MKKLPIQRFSSGDDRNDRGISFPCVLPIFPAELQRRFSASLPHESAQMREILHSDLIGDLLQGKIAASQKMEVLLQMHPRNRGTASFSGSLLFHEILQELLRIYAFRMAQSQYSRINAVRFETDHSRFDIPRLFRYCFGDIPK